MSVISVKIPANREGAFGISLLKYGVALEAEAIDRDPSEAFLYVDIVGDADKVLRACLGMNAEILDCVPSVPRENDKYSAGPRL